MILVLLLGFGISELIAPHKWHPVMVPRHKVQRLCFKYGTVPASTDKCLAKQSIYTNPRHPWYCPRPTCPSLIFTTSVSYWPIVSSFTQATQAILPADYGRLLSANKRQCGTFIGW